MTISNKGYTGYSSEEFAIGVKKSEKWKNGTSEALDGDYVSVVADEIPTFKPTPKTTEQKRIGRKKRNPKVIIGADGAEFSFKQVMNNNYMNLNKDLIEGTIGKLVDLNGEETTNATVTDAYTITFASASEAQKVYAGTSTPDEVHVVAIYDGTTNALLDIDFAISINDDEVTFAGVLANVGSTVKCKKIPAIDFDSSPDTLVDFLIQLASNYDYTENPVYGGALAAKMINCLGSAKFELPIQENGTVEYTYMADSLNYLNPYESRSPIVLTPVGIPAGTFTMIYDYFIKSNQQEYTGTISVTTKALADHLSDIQTALTALAIPNLTVSVVGSTLKFVSSDVSIDVVINTNGVDASTPPDIYFSKTLNSGVTAQNLEWLKVNKDNTISSGVETFTGTNTDPMEVSVTASGTFLKVGGEVELLVNGCQFLVTVPNFDSGDDIDDVAEAVFDLLVAQYEAMDVNDELNFTLSNSIANTLSIVAKNHYTPLTVLVNTKGVDTVFTVDNSANVIDGELYDEDAPFVKFDKVYIGTAGEEMVGWCEAESITLDYTRDVKEIKSLCGSQGRKGWFNRNYTLYLDISTIDVDAKRVYDKFVLFKGNETFALSFVDKTSGMSMFFPACKFESCESVDSDGIRGHSFRINVNFKFEVKPIITLPLHF